MKPKFWNKGRLYLSKKDRVLKSIISTYQNEYLSINKNYFHCLLNSIIGQQISVSAANSIKRRFFSLKKNINPISISTIKTKSLREVGLSRQKILYINNISEFFIQNKKFIKNINKFSEEEQRNVIKKIVSTLDKEGVAKDIIGYPKAPPGLRLWGGATVQNNDMKALLPWIDWAYNSVKNNA